MLLFALLVLTNVPPAMSVQFAPPALITPLVTPPLPLVAALLVSMTQAQPSAQPALLFA